MIPARLKTWIFIWTPVAWLVLELIRYPRDTGWADGFGAMLKGFVDASVGGYPAWVLLVFSVISLLLALVGFLRRIKKSVLFDALLVLLAVDLAVWCLSAAGLFGGDDPFSLKASAGSHGWIYQTRRSRAGRHPGVDLGQRQSRTR